MKPDFFDDNDVLNIQGSSEDEIDGGPSIECKSRYILVFELYNEDELKKCEEFNKYFYDLFCFSHSKRTLYNW